MRYRPICRRTSPTAVERAADGVAFRAPADGQRTWRSWETKFASFGHEAAAAASLGQVHRALLHDGTDVACKLQYPDMPSTVEADLRQLRLAMAIYHRMDNAIQHEEMYKELASACARNSTTSARPRRCGCMDRC